MLKGLFSKKQKADPISIVINDDETLAALQSLGLKVEKGEADGEYIVTNDVEAAAPVTQEPQPPASGAADPFVNELKSAFGSIGGVEGFITMLNQLQDLLDSARQNAEQELSRKKDAVKELKKNGACTLSETTLMKMEISEIEALQKNLEATFGNFSLQSGADGTNTTVVRHKGIGLSGSLVKKQAQEA